MKTPHLHPALILFLAFGIFSAGACSPQPTPTPFRPPTFAAPTQIQPTTTPVPQIVAALPTFTAAPTIMSAETAGPCSNDLTFISDLTIPDGTVFQTGATLDKQWSVQNTGTCNWDASYKLVWIGGDPLGADIEQALYPAKAGSQASLRIIFTAPLVEGIYESVWQASDPDGNVFGDPFSIKISVATQL